MWLGHLISCLFCVNSSGIALTGISPNTSSAYVEKKTLAQTYTTSHQEKKQERGKRGCIYIGPDLLSRFEIQTGTKGHQTCPGAGSKHLSRLVYQAATNSRGRNLGSFLCRGREFIFFSFIYFLFFISK